MVFVFFALVLLALGAGLPGVLVALIVAATWVGVAWSKAADVVLDLSEAEAASEETHARLFNTTAGLCAAMGVSSPTLYVVDDPALNAMATGTDPRNAALVFTSGALDELELVELEAVIALQLHRIKVANTVPETIAVPTIGVSLVLSEAFDRWPALSSAFALPASPVMKLMRKLHPGKAEFDSDVAAVRYTRFPPALASALEKMSGRSALAVGAAVTAHLWVAPPLVPAAGAVTAGVHAPLGDRVAVLREL